MEYGEFEDMMGSQMGEPISADDMKYYFKKFDQNGDGSITRDELELVMKTFGGKSYSKEEIDEMLAHADINSDGKVDYAGNVRYPFSPFWSDEIFVFASRLIFSRISGPFLKATDKLSGPKSIFLIPFLQIAGCF